jgi:hypothetical protein
MIFVSVIFWWCIYQLQVGDPLPFMHDDDAAVLLKEYEK